MKRVLAISMIVLVVAGLGVLPALATDGRLNSSPDDAAAPLVAYCVNESVEVWHINADGHGTFGFSATSEEVAEAVAATLESGSNTLIAGDAGNGLYALISNEVALISSDLKEPWKHYVFSFAPETC